MGTKKAATKAGTSKEAAKARKARFIEAYIANGGNATEAAKAAGYSHATARQQGSRLLSDADIASELSRRSKQLGEKFELTSERVLQEVARVAYADPRRLFNQDGTLKPLHELDDDTAAMVASVEVEEIKAGGAVIGLTKKYKLWDKNSALEKAMKHLGQYEKDNLQRNPIKDLSEDALQRFIERKAKEAGVTLH